MKQAVAAFLLCLIASPALAGPYLGALVGGIELKDDALGTVTAASVLAGYQFGRHLSLEGRLGAGRERSGAAGDYGVDSFAAALLRLDLRNDDIRHYLLVGPARVAWHDALEGEQASRSGGIAYGVGLSLHVRQHSLQFEYLRLRDAGRYPLDALSVGLLRHF